MKKEILCGVVAVLATAATGWGQVMPPALEGLFRLTGTVVGGAATTPVTRPAEKPTLIELTVDATGPVAPVFRYSLVTRVEDLKPGNAALSYQAAVNKFRRTRVDAKYWDLEEKIRREPIGAMTRAGMEELEKLFPRDDIPRYWIDRGARQKHAEWPTDIREGLNAMLPPMGDYRTLANRLAIDAKWDLHERRYAQAIHTIRVGLTMGRHIGESDTLAEALFGNVIVQQMADRLLELSGQPGAPNMYWSVAQLPQPLISMPIANDQSWVYFSMPELKRVRDGKFTDEDWNTLMKRLADPNGLVVFRHLNDDDVPSPGLGELAVLRMNLHAYPRARQFFKEQGKTEREIDAMGARQLVARYYVESYEAWKDEFNKGLTLGYAERRARFRDAQRRMEQSPDANSNFLLESLGGFSAAIRMDGYSEHCLALVRVVEAIKDYAASHAGKWPAKLEDCALPTPLNPMTGKAFEYRVEGGKAVIYAEAYSVPRSKQVKLTIRKPAGGK